jgi:hypothetical protein
MTSASVAEVVALASRVAQESSEAGALARAVLALHRALAGATDPFDSTAESRSVIRYRVFGR